MNKILDRINSPEDVKNLSLTEMDELAQNMRECIINRVNKIGGHLGPDLGIVETVIAMHYVFNSPTDKFVFDVSHQCYPHKMITGRKEGFIEPIDTRISGFTNPNESIHDNFAIGHCSTSISLATGLAKARDLKKENYNIIALIGDGSLSGGEALEGLNNSAILNSNFIIILNDNEMSIAENVGGLYKNLELLRETNGEAENNIFKAMGFDYMYVEEGNNIEKLIEAFNKIKDINHPVVVHIHTLKGNGYSPAVMNKEKFHWITPGFLNEQTKISQVDEDYSSITKDFILNKKSNNENIVVITAATPGVFGFDKSFREKLGENYIDVAIAEEHAVTFASGLAKNGAKPILALMSSFIQRTYDQLAQDIALNNSPALILVYWGGISSSDMTHLCTFDIPLISNIPNIVYLAPAFKEEYLAMLNWAYEQNTYPVIIRVPNVPLKSRGIQDKTDYSILNKYEVVKKGEKIAILGLGNFFDLGEKLMNELKRKLNITSTLINPKYITGLDKEVLNELKSQHSLIITLEDGELDGGWGEKISRFFASSDVKVLNYGAFKEFTDRIPLKELYERYHLTTDKIIEDIINFI